MGQRNAELLDLYLDSVPNAVDRMGDELAYPRSRALVRKLLTRGLDRLCITPSVKAPPGIVQVVMQARCRSVGDL